MPPLCGICVGWWSVTTPSAGTWLASCESRYLCPGPKGWRLDSEPFHFPNCSHMCLCIATLIHFQNVNFIVDRQFIQREHNCTASNALCLLLMVNVGDWHAAFHHVLWSYVQKTLVNNCTFTEEQPVSACSRWDIPWLYLQVSPKTSSIIQ